MMLASLLVLLACTKENKENSGANDVISTAKILELKQNGDNIILLDVRTPDEVAAGMIPGALHIDYHGENFSSKLDQLDKEAHIIVYCKSGGRAGKACDELRAKGFKKYTNYGGYDRWLKESK